MGLRIEWDPDKAAVNESKHGVSFSEAATALVDPLSITLPDPDHSREEERLLLLGPVQHRPLSHHRAHGARGYGAPHQCAADDFTRAEDV